MVAARVKRALEHRAARRGSKLRQRIAEPHREIAQPALVADPVNGAAGEALVKFGLAPGEKRRKRRTVQPVTHREVGLARRCRKAIPRARELAVVAAIDAVTDERAQRLGNRAL